MSILESQTTLSLDWLQTYIGLAEDIAFDAEELLKVHPESAASIGGIKAVAENLAYGLKEHMKNLDHPTHWKAS